MWSKKFPRDDCIIHKHQRGGGWKSFSTTWACFVCLNILWTNHNNNGAFNICIVYLKKNAFLSFFNRLWYGCAFAMNLHLFRCKCTYVCELKWLFEREGVWTWMLISVFVNDERRGKTISIYVRNEATCLYCTRLALQANINMQLVVSSFFPFSQVGSFWPACKWYKVGCFIF